MTVITVVDGKSTLSVLKSNGFQSLDDDVVMDKIIHFSHGGSNLFLSSVCGTVVLSILLDSALGLSGFCMLSGDKNSVDLGGDHRSIGKLIVSDGDLGLSIGTKPPERSILTHIGELLSELVGKKVGQGHAALGFVRGVSKHDTLVTGTDVHVVLSNMDTSGDIGGLLVDTNEHLAGVAGETLGLHGGEIVNEGAESNLADLITDNFLVVEVGGGGDLSKDHDHVVFGGGLACDLGHGVGGEAGVKDGIGDLIAELVGVSFVDGLGREEE
jgi:hypothetical protein